MKFLSLVCVFLLSVNAAHAANDDAKSVIVCDGKRFVYADCVLPVVGGPAQHFIVVHEETAAFEGAWLKLRLQPKPFRPDVAYLSIGPSATVPLSRYGVYLLKATEGDGIEMEFLIADLPKKDDRTSIEEFIRLVLKRPTTEKEHAEWMKEYLKR